MAYHICSSSSASLFHDCQLVHNSIQHTQKPRVRSFTHFNKPNCIIPSLKTSLHVASVSLQDPVQITQDDSLPEDANSEDPNGKSATSSKSYVWVNPKSPRAAKLKKKSHDAWFNSLVKVSESLDYCNPDEDAVFSILKGLGAKVTQKEAVGLINNMSNPDVAEIALKYFLQNLKTGREVVMYNVTLKVFRKSGYFDRAVKLFDDMLERGIKPDNITFSTIISCARRCNLHEKAVEWFEKMPTFGCEPDDVTYTAIIDAYARAGNLDTALSLYDRARSDSCRIDAITFSTLIKMYGLSGNYDGCLNLYEEMKALGAKPNMVIYHTLLDAMGRARRPWQVKAIYNDMLSKGFTPNYSTYACLLRAFGRARYANDALSIYKETKEKELKLDIKLYNGLLSMCADIGNVDEAIEIFDDMKNSGCKPDSWTFSSMITVHSCNGEVDEAEKMLLEMSEAGFEPTIFCFTSLIQCYGNAKRTDDVVSTFQRVLELGICPDELFCGCLLNVMTQTPKEELHKLSECVDKANPKLGFVVRLLLQEQADDGNFRNEALDLLNSIGDDVKKAFCNCLIDLCINLDFLEKACQLLDIGLTLGMYADIQSRSQTQWSLHLKSLSLGAALTALHVWINDLCKALESGEEFPPLLGINTGHGKHKYSDKSLAGVFESHLKDLNAPFHEAPDKAGWFLTTKVAMQSWLQSRNSSEPVTASSS